ncbi:MAG: exodeoxyribonuclease V subunit gamma [Candidatus Omnitrophica bacterium]|nr:exodeoxyribonuclease V subunit gamma [Candidatus Omnitrophota bacterium]MDD5671018.1 exodeoxyribonuclease V subunit gamma [Candidatus Omnitrophota bacterium]
MISQKILLIGPAGSGKTKLVLDDVEKTLRSMDDPLQENCFLILPSAEHTERALSLILQRGIKGFFHHRVTTLERLITQCFGAGHERVASHVTRFLFIRELFERHDWDYFREVRERPGFLNLILGFLDELKEALVPAPLFRERMNALKRQEPDFSPKYEALAEIYEGYESRLAAEGLSDVPDVFLSYAGSKRKGARPPFRFRKIWLDGFFDFSNLQLACIRELAGVTDEMVITLTRDTRPGRESLFEPVQATEQALAELGFEKRELPFSDKKWGRSPALGFLERHLFGPDKPKKAQVNGGAMTVFEAVGVEGEVEMIAREIKRLYRMGDYRLSDMAVLLRRVGNYEDALRAVFKRFEIPVEIHERECLEFTPILRVIVDLLRIFREGWRRHDLIQFLKSSYVRRLDEVPKDFIWIGELEHRAIREGVLKGREGWLGFWMTVDRDDGKRKQFHEQKLKVLKPLCDLEDALRRSKPFSELRRHLVGAVEKTFAIFQMEDELSERTMRDGAGYRRFEALLDEIEASFGGDSGKPMDFDAFADRFFHLVELDLYSLHERDRNKVQVYDVSLARQKDYRVVFLAGLAEKEFPVQIREDPVLSDWERRLFNGRHTEGLLRERLPRQNMEKYLFYLAVTRAEEKLYLSYPRLDLEGQETLPSYYLEEVRTIFRDALTEKRQDLAHPYPDLTDVSGPRELEAAVLGDLWRPPADDDRAEPLLLSLTNHLLSEAESRARIRRAFYQVEDRLTDPKIRAGNYFGADASSPTALETFAQCPYLYFAERVMGLVDPEEEINIKLKGTIRHKLLEDFFKVWIDKAGAVSEAEIKKFVEKELDKLLAANPLVEEKKYQFELDRQALREAVEAFILAEVEDLRSAPLKPRYLEFCFGTANADEAAFVIKDGERAIKIKGKIDRIDVDEGGRFGLVIDYKSTVNFKRGDLELGLELQLPLYLMVMEQVLKLQPVGGELFSIKEHKRKGFHHAGNVSLSGYPYKGQLALTEKEYRDLLASIEGFVREFTRGMAEAVIRVRPRDEMFCKQLCSYATLCRIEKWRIPLIVQEIKEEMQARKAVQTDGLRASQGTNVKGKALTPPAPKTKPKAAGKKK